MLLINGDAKRVAGPTAEQVWQEVGKFSFAVVSYVTPGGEARSSGVVYRTAGRRMFIAVAADSWKAKHIAATCRVAVTVPMRRGGLVSLLFPIPPATVSFHGSAVVHPAMSPEGQGALRALGQLLPPERRESGVVIEIRPEGRFVTYGLGVPLRDLRDPGRARALVPVA
jgi:hypothetical protein